ncbi:aspartate aminotransferase [Cribrihabitans neustonicus]|uniref:aspartate aminotransferase n=1 Tax=Cribrihabitans neustonicus TaxID=1429085 RepID=UPI003B5CB547
MRGVFQCKAVQNGQVIRRKIRDIERYAGMEAFLAEVSARGFQAVQNRGQVVTFCNSAPLRRLV